MQSDHPTRYASWMVADARRQVVLKYIALIACFFLFCSELMAADFRTLDFGESCSGIKTEEYQLGNSPKVGQNTRDTYYAFNGVFLDRAVTINYYCGKDNKLDRGMYSFNFTNESDLEAFFKVARPNLMYLLGPPAYDGASLNPDKKTNIFRYDIRWEKEGITINVKVVGNFNEPNPQKRVQIWFRPIE